MRNGCKGVSQDRLDAVERVRQGWISRLIDLSRRNNLLYYRDLKTGTLDLSNSDPEAIAALLRGESVPFSRLLLEEEQDQATVCIQQIYRRALTNLEEKGLTTLFLALGMATWTATDGGRPPEAAVILVPIQVEMRAAVKLQRSGEAQINPVLLHILEAEYGCQTAPQELLDGADSIAEDETPDLWAIAERLKQATQDIQGFEIIPRLVLSNFSFQKMAMVRDLRDRLPEMAEHDLIAAIAGNGAARQAVQGSGQDVDVKTLDRISPDQEFLVFDADSSQQKVIYEVLSNRNCVIQGPPGTGKSQTIANLITALAAKGLRTLFVAEKRAALEVVMQRLQRKGLGHLLLDFHSADVSRRAVMEQFAESLRLVRNAPLVDAQTVHRRFVDRRGRLHDHVARMHQVRSPAEKSVYQFQGELLQFSQAEQNSTRLRGKNLQRLTPANAERVEALLHELSSDSLADLFLGNQTSLWTDIPFASRTAAQQALERVQQIADERYPALESSLVGFAQTTTFQAPSTLDRAREQVALAEAVTDTLSRYTDGLFQQNLEQCLQALSPLQQGLIAKGVARLFDGNFKTALSTLRKLRRNPASSDEQIFEEVTIASEQFQQWQFFATGHAIPCEVQNLADVQSHLHQLLTELPSLESLLKQRNLSQMPLQEFADLFRTLSAEGETLQRIVRLREIEAELDTLGVKLFLNDLKRTKPLPILWQNQFRYTWLASCLDQARSETPELLSFNGSNHEQLIQEFRNLDQERLQFAIQRVSRAHGERVIAAMNEYPDQAGLVRREAEKRTRHLSLRRLLAEAPDVLMALRPCWMASPLSVSQLLDAERRYFDVVIFDEASQVLPEDAVPAILRAQRVVVAGDKHQLPPTTFFAAGADDSEEESASPAEGFESLLDLMSSFLESRMLEWHYRSRCEELIAFSNRHIYGDRLITFPNPGRSQCVSHVLVPATPGVDGQEESAAREVQSVVDLVLQHATEHPEQSLGVITMGIKHANRIEAALDEALQQVLTERPELAVFFDDSRPERFFVKNIERVQGDEREAIILSVGYGKDRAGKLPYRFGPLLYEGGERRLNVAITRARQRLTLVCSFNHLDMDPNRSNSRGVELLRLYLQYAASEGQLLGDTGHSGVPLNPFEADVFDALSARGLSLLPQWGASGYRIDMVAQHPKTPGRFVLAIECDGASYHSLPTVRERDRLRQQQLEGLGWRFHRIWSTDWFLRRDAEIERAIAAYQIAVRHAEWMDAQKGQPTQQNPVERPGSAQAVPPRAEPQAQRKPRPNVPQRDRIDQYSMDELVKLIRWILSDGYLRTNDEIINEMVGELGFKRRGVKIEAKILQAIQRIRR
jgi:very-short-patch-repair endonuclease